MFFSAGFRKHLNWLKFAKANSNHADVDLVILKRMRKRELSDTYDCGEIILLVVTIQLFMLSHISDIAVFGLAIIVNC